MDQVEQNISPMLFRKEMRAALALQVTQPTDERRKLYTRRILYPINTTVTPGTFADVLWDSAKVKRDDPDRPFLRAQCVFSGGAKRVVSVLPKIEPGQILWVRETRYMSRARSTMTLLVDSVGISRINDLTDEQAMQEGVALLPPGKRKHGTPRDWFATLWDDIHGRGAWARNDWVWIYGVQAHLAQVDHWLAGKEDFP